MNRHQVRRRWRRVAGSVLPVIVLAACSGEPAGPCRLQSVADLPATTQQNRLEIMARVDGAETRFLLDTGAERTVLAAATVASLRLPRSQHSTTRLAGIGGVVSNADAYASLQLGQVDVQRQFPVADLAGIGGLVGADVLGDYDVELDIPDQRVRLWRAAGCGVADLPWQGPRTTVEIRVTGGGLVALPVVVDGSEQRALLDSGSALSLMTVQAAQRAGVSQAALADDATVPVRGVDGAAINLRNHRFAQVTLAGETRRGVRLAVGPLRLADDDMLLGVDFLRSRRLWISYRTRRLYLQVMG